MRLIKEDEGRELRKSDFPWLLQHLLVLRPNAVDRLGKILSEYGELLPLACDEVDLVAFNACAVSDVLDLEKSDIVRFPSSEKILDVSSYAFKSDLVRGLRIFKVPQLARWTLFVNDELVDLVQSSGLSGLGFRQLWDSEANIVR
jgi:hypothetical protein